MPLSSTADFCFCAHSKFTAIAVAITAVTTNTAAAAIACIAAVTSNDDSLSRVSEIGSFAFL
jgi:hypothetical protein